MTLLGVIGWAVLGLGGVGALYALAGAGLVWRFMRRPQAEPAEAAVTILKPLHGVEPGLASTLGSFFEQDYGAPTQIVFGVQDAADPAIAVVQALGRGADLVVDARATTGNRKVANLINMLPKARHDLLVLSDSDIRVGRNYLSHIVAALAAPGVGAVTCLYRGEAAAGVWSRLSAMAISYSFLPNAVLGSSLGLARPCFGSTIALTRQTLAEIGGFGAFEGDLADDYAIGAAVWASGRSVAIPPMTVTHLCDEASLGQLFEHELRWAVTIRGVQGAGHAGSLVTHALPLTLIGAALLAGHPVALGVAAAALIARLSLKFTVDAVTGASAGPLWLLPARDLMSFAVFLGSFCVNSVGWRGRRFRVGSRGLLLRP